MRIYMARKKYPMWLSAGQLKTRPLFRLEQNAQKYTFIYIYIFVKGRLFRTDKHWSVMSQMSYNSVYLKY